MEDVIYILLAVAWVVFSVVKGAKKKTATQTTQRPKTELEEIFGEFFPKPVEPEPVYESLEDIQPEYIEEVEQSDEYYSQYVGILEEDPIHLDDDFAQNNQDKSDPLAHTIKPERERQQFNFHSTFDLRKAMIYQILLQRPDY
jgi:hypothetical protein